MRRFTKVSGLIVSLMLLVPLVGLFAQDVPIKVDALMHNSRSSLYRTPGGAAPFGTTVTLRLRTATGDLEGVDVRVWSTRAQQETLVPMKVAASTPDGYDLWEAKVDVGNQTTLLWYRFLLHKGGQTFYYEDDTKPDGNTYFAANEGGVGMFYTQSPDLSYLISVYDPNYYTPQWMRDGVLYQIFPDRFRDGDTSNDPTDNSDTFYGSLPLYFHETWNEKMLDGRVDKLPDGEGYWSSDFYGGDLAGITQELDYLQSLGVTGIYLNPIFEARSNHRYDTADYKKIDPILGTLDDFRKLVKEADKRGIKIILDGVFNHMSSDSAAFDRYHRFDTDGACESLTSPYRNWFFFTPPKSSQPSPCVGDNGNMFYVSWAGFDSIPKLNNTNADVRNYIFAGKDSVVQTWGNEGIGGWRLDVAGDIDNGSPDNDYWESFRRVVRQINPEAVVIGEEWNNASQWLLGDQWDSTMNYRFRRGMVGFARGTDFVDDDGLIPGLTPSQFDATVRSLEEDYPPMAYHAMMNLMDSHDTTRILFALDNDKSTLKLAALTQFTLPGAPTIYYGDEIALNAPDVNDGNILQDDPYNRAPYPWTDASGNYYSAPDADMLAYYQQLGKLRHDNPALSEGSMTTLLANDTSGVYAYLRVDAAAGNAVLVVVNRANKDQVIPISYTGLLPAGLTLESPFGSAPTKTDTGGAIIKVAAHSGDVWAVNTGKPFAAPNAPQNVKATGVPGNMTISWDAVDGAAGYIVYRSPVAEGGFEPMMRAPITDTHFVDTSVASGFVYYYAVVAVGNDKLMGAQSTSVLGVPNTSIGASAYLGNVQAPTIIQLHYGVTVELQASVKVEGLTETEGAAQGIRAEAALVPAGESVENAHWQSMIYASDQDGSDVYGVTFAPQAAGAYRMVVRFSADAGQTWTQVKLPDNSFPQLVVQPSDDTTAPAAPASVKVERASLSGVSLSWEAVNDGTLAAYRVYRTGDDKQSQLLSEVPKDRLTYTDKSVQDGKTYTYAVTAVDNGFNESSQATTEPVLVERQKLLVTFVAEVPAATNSPVFIAGNFGSSDYPTWDPAGDGMQMTQVDATHWQITLKLPEGAAIEYKFVRGTWDAVEKGDQCEEIANRTLTVRLDSLGELSTQYVAEGSYVVQNKVAKWRDLDKCG